MDENVFESGLDLPPLVLIGAKRRDRAFERGRVAAADVQRIAEGHRLLHARLVAKFQAQADSGR